MRTCRLHFTDQFGWVLDVPTTVTAEQIQRIVKWALPKQIDRWRCLMPGERKENLGRAIELLKQGKVTQNVIDDDRDGIVTPFKSTEKTTNRLITYG